jgi:hypothetical protein
MANTCRATLCISHGTFADDEIIVASSRAELQEIVQEVSSAMRSDDAPLGVVKTAWFANNNLYVERNEVDGARIPRLQADETLPVLGISFDCFGGTKADFDTTIVRCWRTFWGLPGSILQPIPKEVPHEAKDRIRCRHAQIMDRVVGGIHCI